MRPGSIVRIKIKYDMKASSAITLKLILLSEVSIFLKPSPVELPEDAPVKQ